ncbi:MAG: MmcQ/YjbR family DNA-binding protein [Pseudomonadota bacterium]
MTPAEAEAHALTLPGTFMVVQWMGSHVLKVGTPDKNKMFGVFAGDDEGRVTLKCADDETAAFLIEIGAASKAPHLPRGGWIALTVADVGDDELRERIETSYATVRASLPKAVQAALG